MWWVMSRPKPTFHSLYKGYKIYHREGIKRRPWLALIFPEKETCRFASLASLEAAKVMIERVIRSKEIAH